MDWDGVIEKNREALKRILAMLVATARLTIGHSPRLWGRCPAGQRGVNSREMGATRPTLPRRLHRAVLRLLRPAEAAARRLVIMAARDLKVELPPARPRKSKPIAPVLRSLGIAVVLSPAEAARAAALARRARAPRGQIALPLTDPIRVYRPGRPRYVPAHAAPRILTFDGARPHRLPPPPGPDDPVDATRLGLRLGGLGRALDGLQGHARRFARWRARRGRGLVRRISPLRPGRPPGQSAATGRRPTHEVHEILADMQYFAREALKSPDTS